MKTLNKTSLVAPCGINCEVCIAYLREKNKCCGCRGADLNKPITRVKCKIKTCEILINNKAKFCFKCKNFPCEKQNRLNLRYKIKYNISTIENLNYIKKFGIRKFIQKEQIKWRCLECGGTICVHKGYCINCGI